MSPTSLPFEAIPAPYAHRILANIAYRSVNPTPPTLLVRYYVDNGKEASNVLAIALAIILLFTFFCLMSMGYALCILRIPFAKYWRKTCNPLILIFTFPYHIYHFVLWVKDKGWRNMAKEEDESEQGWSQTMKGEDEELALWELRPQTGTVVGLGIAGVEGMPAR